MKFLQYQEILNEIYNNTASETAKSRKQKPIIFKTSNFFCVSYAFEKLSFSYNTKKETFEKAILNFLKSYYLTQEQEHILKRGY